MVMHRKTKYRQLLTWFFVASLLLNVQSTFACTMMPDMPDLPQPVHECCLAMHKNKVTEKPDTPASSSDTCFTLKVSLQLKASPEADADPGNDHALLKDKPGTQNLAPVMALLVLTVLQTAQTGGYAVPSNDQDHSTPLPVYQATQRYRI